jgi:glycosyltransferase involved in cell wall biosynthesis
MRQIRQQHQDRGLAAPELATPAGASPSNALRPPSVCFVAPNAYSALSGRADLSHGGGAERQQVLLAEELVRRGHRVSFVVLDHGQPKDEEIRGVRILKCYRQDRGIRGVRFLHPRLTGLWCAMARADADVYYQRSAEAETGLVAQWCRQHARAFIFAAASDTDCSARLPLIPRWSERLLFRWGLRCAHAVIVQTSVQQEMMMAEFGIPSAVVRSCFAWPSSAEHPLPGQPGGGERKNILWAGRLSEEKRPEWVIRLARELPGHRFDIVGPCGVDAAYGRRVVAEIESLPNARWHGYVPHHRMSEMYRNARVLLCTSPAEGFPNVFLEAWSCGTGVLSTIDPDGVIDRFQTGKVAAGFEDLKHHLLTLDERRHFWAAAAIRGQQYVQSHHAVRVAGEALVAVIRDATLRAGSHR